ncbi:cupin domain-containing protein [Rhizodiscina lignyota]|uniref:Cupin domain-containing protein n=1 Tax=Rhizodiscina lignyota TaxID=1504668 RepID=A0A9P4ID28_9PEZI|nr:cupin domain-containing protein [Rhizodiscina lignyota]
MPELESVLVKHASKPGVSTGKGPSSLFTGEVFIDTVHNDSGGYGTGGSDSTIIVNVTFAPGARTHWHTHEKGQLLKVLAGSGWVCDKGGKPKRLETGDVCWCPEGITHWHGADDGSLMTHFAFARGSVQWLEPVSEQEYAAKGQ